MRPGKDWPAGGSHLGIQLQNEVVAGLPSAKGEVHHAVHPQLLHLVQAPRAQVLAQLQREVRRRIRLLLHVLQCRKGIHNVAYLPGLLYGRCCLQSHSSGGLLQFHISLPYPGRVSSLACTF